MHRKLNGTWYLVRSASLFSRKPQMKIITIVVLWKSKIANQQCHKQLQTDSMSKCCAYSIQWAWSNFLTLQPCWSQYWSLILRSVLKHCFHIIIVEIEEENWSYLPYAVNQEQLVIILKVIVGLKKQSLIYLFSKLHWGWNLKWIKLQS